MNIDLSRRGLQSFDASEFSQQGAEQYLLKIIKLNLSHNCLSQLSGLHGLTSLKELNVSFNGLLLLVDGSGSRGSLPLSLEKLDLSHNSLHSLGGSSDENSSHNSNMALLPLRQLHTLNLSHNQLYNLKGLPDQVRTVLVSDNVLEKLVGIENCPALEELHVQNNMLKETSTDVIPFLTKLTNLKKIRFSGNPFTLRKRQVIPLLQFFQKHLPSVDHDLPLLLPDNNNNVSTSSVNTSCPSDLYPSYPPITNGNNNNNDEEVQKLRQENKNYIQRIGELENTVHQLKSHMEEQEANTAMLIKLNEQLQRRLAEKYNNDINTNNNNTKEKERNASPVLGPPPLVPRQSHTNTNNRRSLSCGNSPANRGTPPPKPLIGNQNSNNNDHRKPVSPAHPYQQIGNGMNNNKPIASNRNTDLIKLQNEKRQQAMLMMERFKRIEK